MAIGQASLKSLQLIIQQEYAVNLADPDETKWVALYKAEKINQVINGLVRNAPADFLRQMRQEIYALLYLVAGLVDVGNGNNQDNGHLKRVGEYAGLLARHYIIEHKDDYPSYDAETYSRDLAKAAPLHDIGKVCLPKELLVYPGKFNESQREIMKVHVDCGRVILTIDGYTTGKETRIPLSRCAASEHHMPEYGLYACNGPSLAGTIVKLVDSFDAGTSERSYDPAKPLDEVVSSILNPNGMIYNSDVVITFLKHKEEFRQLHDRLHGHH